MKRVLLALSICLVTTPVLAQAWVPPFCTGTNRALQYGSTGWQCVTITGTVGPQGPAGPAGPTGPQGPAGPSGTMPAAPSPSTCITAHWDGTKWNCVPTNNLTTN
jgi:hypothetical protein